MVGRESAPLGEREWSYIPPIVLRNRSRVVPRTRIRDFISHDTDVVRRFDADFRERFVRLRDGDHDIADRDTLASLPGEDQHGNSKIIGMISGIAAVATACHPK